MQSSVRIVPNTLLHLTVPQHMTWAEMQIRVLAQCARDLDIQELFVKEIHKLLSQVAEYEVNPFQTMIPAMRYREWDEILLMEHHSPMSAVLYNTMLQTWSSLRFILFTSNGLPILNRGEVDALVQYLVQDDPCALQSAYLAQWREKYLAIKQREEDCIILMRESFQQFRTLFQQFRHSQMEFELLDLLFRNSKVSWSDLDTKLTQSYERFQEDQGNLFFNIGVATQRIYDSTRTYHGYLACSSYQMERALEELPSYRNCFLESEENE